MGKKIFKIFCSKISFILTYDKNWVLDFSVNTGSRRNYSAEVTRQFATRGLQGFDQSTPNK